MSFYTAIQIVPAPLQIKQSRSQPYWSNSPFWQIANMLKYLNELLFILSGRLMIISPLGDSES